MKEKACKNCRFISMGNICPNCKSSVLSEVWAGLVIVLDVEKSEISRMIGA
ncbi:MAG: transcription elongation factor subunit Spt4, partial [Candidatus Bathyarchaeia archaeon]